MPNPRRRRSRNCFSRGEIPRRPPRKSRMARPPTGILVARSWVRPRLTRGRRLRLWRPMKSANVTASVWNGCAASPQATRLRASPASWAARSCDPSSWVSWRVLGYAASPPAAAPPIPSAKLGSALGPKWRATVPPAPKGKDLRPQEEESPPIDLSIVQEVEKQQAEAGNEGNEAKNGSEAKDADETKLTKETKVVDLSASRPVTDGRETDSTNGPTVAIPLARPEEPPSQHIRRHSGEKGHSRGRHHRSAFHRLTGVARAYPFVWSLAR